MNNIVRRIRRFLRHFPGYYWVRDRTVLRMNVLKMKYLKPSWCDRSEMLIHAMFQVLCDFIEKEKPWETVDWKSDEYHVKAWHEMMYLYSWWKYRNLKRYDENPLFKPGVKAPDLQFIEPGEEQLNPLTKKKEMFHELKFVHKTKEDEEIWKKACEDSNKWDVHCDKEDEKMMVRLIKVRGFMWT